MSITAGNFIFKENDIGDNFYLIESGQVEVIKKTDGNPARHVRFLPTGEHFGEQALIGNNG
jgi:CRP-like cAMP-binding protein